MFSNKDNNMAINIFNIVKNGKSREIVSYSSNKHGNKLRKSQEKIFKKILSKFPSSNNSFAYKNNVSTKNAFDSHMNSKLFIKCDIKKFFESISLDRFISVVENIPLEKNDISSCFYNEHLPLGFVTSPKLSDMYLFKFDATIEDYLSKHNKLHYSRYCDDILLSTEEDNFGDLHTLLSFIKKKLGELNLEINEIKTREFDLEKDTAVSFLGLNLSKDGEKHKITISKKFILKTLDLLEKAYCLKERKETMLEFLHGDYRVVLFNKRHNCIDEKHEKSNQEKYIEYRNICCNLEYLKNVVKSRVGYIKYNSSCSYQRFLSKHIHKFGKEWGEIWL